MRYTELPKPLQRFAAYPESEYNDRGRPELNVAAPEQAYLLILLLRWIVDVYNENPDGKSFYEISWEMGGGVCRSEVNRNVTVFVTIANRRGGEPVKRQLCVLESFSRGGIAVVEFANGAFGRYRMSGTTAVRHLIEQVVNAPTPSRLPYYTPSLSVIMHDIEGGVQLETLGQNYSRPAFSVKLSTDKPNFCTTLEVEWLHKDIWDCAE
jgi:hypothetical protein